MAKKICFIRICLVFLLIVNSVYTWNRLEKNNNVVTDYIALSDEPVETYENNTEKQIIDEYIKKYKNKEIVGEISLLDTDYKKAIVQHNDNDYYLNHTENKKSNFMGAIFLDYRVNINSSKKLLIYGHNSSRVSMPFKILEEYYDYEYYNKHPYIQIITNKATKLFKIYSVYIEVEDFDYMKTDFKNNDEWYNHISKLKKKSFYDTGVDINKYDNVLILQTCSTHKDYKKYKDKFLLVVAKEVK